MINAAQGTTASISARNFSRLVCILVLERIIREAEQLLAAHHLNPGLRSRLQLSRRLCAWPAITTFWCARKAWVFQSLLNTATCRMNNLMGLHSEALP